MAEAREPFKSLLAAAFAEVQVGQAFAFTRTITAADVALFCGITGDYNPYHIDAEFAREGFFGQPIAPGLLTGSMLTHIGGLLGFLATDMAFEFLGPVFVGDTITCTLTVAEKDETRRRVVADASYLNQRGEEVLRARCTGFPSRIRLAR